jgi:hypothetical protein
VPIVEEIEKNRYWVDDFTQELLKEFLDENQVFYFQFEGRDYLIEHYVNGFLIADPIPYYENGGYPNNPKYQDPMSFKAKSTNEFLDLPFLEGRTILEQWDKIKFWNF